MALGQIKESFMKGLITGGVGKVKRNHQGMVKYLGARNSGSQHLEWQGEGMVSWIWGV